MTCAEFERTSAFLDGELDAHASVEAERHIAGCQECQAFAASAAALSDALRAPTMRHHAPPALRGRILAEITRAAAPSPARPRPRATFLWGALSGAGATSLAAAALLVALIPPSASTLAVGLVDDHVRALDRGALVAVRSSDHHKVKPWLASHAPLSPPVTNFAAQGFPLLGARVDKVRGRPMAVLAYAQGAHEIDLYVWPAEGPAPPPSAERHGFHERAWTRGDLRFAAISDVSPDALTQFVGLVQQAGE
jgi:anti-sigma factor RsiW